MYLRCTLTYLCHSSCQAENRYHSPCLVENKHSGSSNYCEIMPGLWWGVSFTLMAVFLLMNLRQKKTCCGYTNRKYLCWNFNWDLFTSQWHDLTTHIRCSTSIYLIGFFFMCVAHDGSPGNIRRINKLLNEKLSKLVSLVTLRLFFILQQTKSLR